MQRGILLAGSCEHERMTRSVPKTLVMFAKAWGSHDTRGDSASIEETAAWY